MNWLDLRTSRLILSPVNWQDMPDILALKTDVLTFSSMLGGVRSSWQVQKEMAEDILYWGSHRIGIYTVRKHIQNRTGQFLGITGIHLRNDNRGHALRFALWGWAQGKGYACEAAFAVLLAAHERGYQRIVAVTKERNIASRRILGSIGMNVEEQFMRHGYKMLTYVSVLS
ncbi:MAG: GNAT family N-acetyltransferase [Commensalibacter sp.]|nr:GNAT family N-acetyltransferase [Commensalibacter sp.]